MSAYTVGIDIGRSIDYTALVVVESNRFEDDPAPEPMLHARYVEQFRGVPYREIEDYLAGLAQTFPVLRSAPFVIDTNNAGRPVFEGVRQHIGNQAVALYSTGAQSVVKVSATELHVPKRDLVAAVRYLWGAGRLKIAPGVKYADALRAQIEDYGSEQTESGHVTYGGRHGHDDLHAALSLAVWYSWQKGGSHAQALDVVRMQSRRGRRIPQQLSDMIDGLSPRARARQLGYLDGRPPGLR
jgi:hypothetical protein